MLRDEADRNEKTIVTTLYQAGNGIFDQFDKVLVLAEGRTIYYGPRSFAKKYFEDLGFVCPKGANIADFLTSVTVKTERIVSPGAEGKVPNTAEEFETILKASNVYKQMIASIIPPESLTEEAEALSEAVAQEKGKKHIPRKHSVYTAGLWDQVVSCTVRSVI
jgi:ATP-binding cassette subfamily G (WHITE) protein 2 (SNQ2)